MSGIFDGLKYIFLFLDIEELYESFLLLKIQGRTIIEGGIFF
jgi:hypothetical protein